MFTGEFEIAEMTGADRLAVGGVGYLRSDGRRRQRERSMARENGFGELGHC